MFAHTKAFSGFSVDDPDAARRFYGETLGIEVADAGGPGLLTLQLAFKDPAGNILSVLETS
jgi:catechol 2,3-dioxygenase-like lactoylglutathione lyase family enzyme